MSTVISVVNAKGGVGKTTTAVNLAVALAERGRRVLLIDLDSQANATKLCGVKAPATSIFDALLDTEAVPLRSIIQRGTAAGLDVAPGHRALIGLEAALQSVIGREALLGELIEPELPNYDYILIDNGPKMGIAPAMSLHAADVALIPLQCERLALEGLAEVRDSVSVAQRRINPRLRSRILLTMLDGRTKDGSAIATAVRGKFPRETYKTEIRRWSALSSGSAAAGSILQYAPKTPGAEAYRALAAEIEADAP